MPQFTRAIHLRFHFAGTDTTQDDTYDPKIYVKSNWTELWNRGSDATIQMNQQLLLHGHLFLHQERRQVIMWQHLLPTGCH